MKLLAGLCLGLALSCGVIIGFSTSVDISHSHTVYKQKHRHYYPITALATGCSVVLMLGSIQCLIHVLKKHEKS